MIPRNRLTDNQIIWAFIVALTVLALALIALTSKVYADEYYNLEDLTTDQYVEKNEGLQPEYDQTITPPNVWPLECGIERETPISTYTGEKDMPNNLTIYFYDTNNDGKADVQIYVPTNDLINRYPLFYSIDRDFDGETAEITYVDEDRDGTCTGIGVYWTKSKGFLKPQYGPNYKEGA